MMSTRALEIVDEQYKEFISHGTVDVADSRVSVVILRDTGATQSLMIGDVKCMPSECTTGRKVLIHDVNGGTQSVPLFRVNLQCELISGDVIVGIVPFLPMDGVSFLLGNDLAGGRVSVLPVVSEVPVSDQQTEKLAEEFPGIFSACVVTRAQARKKESERENNESDVSLGDTLFGRLPDVRSACVLVTDDVQFEVVGELLVPSTDELCAVAQELTFIADSATVCDVVICADAQVRISGETSSSWDGQVSLVDDSQDKNEMKSQVIVEKFLMEVV